MNKTLFIKRIDGDIRCRVGRPCQPFLGWRVSNYDEFVAIIKKYFDKETGYPGLFFSTKYNNIKVVFSGHQYEHGEEGRWCIFNTDTDNYPTGWMSLKDNFDTIFELFEDTEKVQAWADAITKIVNAQGGITIEVK